MQVIRADGTHFPNRPLAVPHQAQSVGPAAKPRLRLTAGSVRTVRVRASPEAVRLVQDQGGKVYVWAKRTRCCGGSLIFLEASSDAGERPCRRAPADGIELYFDERLREPEVLELDVGGLRRKHVHAYWDGCAYVV